MEGPVGGLVVGDIGRRHEPPLDPPLRVGGPDAHQLVRSIEREITQQHGIDDAENRRIGSNAERDSEDGNRREARMAPEVPDGEAKILQQQFHTRSGDGGRRGRLLGYASRPRLAERRPSSRLEAPPSLKLLDDAAVILQIPMYWSL